MNNISSKILTGTLGELLVQIRLLQYGVQAAPPIKDSGNDLIAVNGQIFRSVSIRTTTTGIYRKPPQKRFYHVLAVVDLKGHDQQIWLDQSRIFLIPREKALLVSTRCEMIGQWAITGSLVKELFGPPSE